MEYGDNFMGIVQIGVNQMQIKKQIKYSYMYLAL